MVAGRSHSAGGPRDDEDCKRGAEVLALYNAAHELTKHLDNAGVPTVFSRIRNIPRAGSKGPSGRRPDLMPVAMKGLMLGAWPHRSWDSYKALWEDRGIETSVMASVLKEVHDELAAQGPRKERFTAGFAAAAAANEELRRHGLTINFHMFTRGDSVERDVFFLTITPWEDGPVFPQGIKPSVKFSLGHHACTWQVHNVYTEGEQGALSFEKISNAKHFGQVWRSNARQSTETSGRQRSSSARRKKEPAIKRAVRLITAAAMWQKESAPAEPREEAPCSPPTRPPSAAGMGPGSTLAAAQQQQQPQQLQQQQGQQQQQHPMYFQQQELLQKQQQQPQQQQQHQQQQQQHHMYNLQQTDLDLAAVNPSPYPPNAVSPLAAAMVHSSHGRGNEDHIHQHTAVCQNCAGSGVVQVSI
eukprot:TRINITY_DN6255_c2_g1_i1.p1 TRINITY_DN6255_c2_g1~~TRINITY_DN6255_c2_g1_i1.p1  ORF type:complete len:414 (-),score=91.93 TRINITY_DN6255_c2_g1_i1:45-1286(-)